MWNVDLCEISSTYIIIRHSQVEKVEVDWEVVPGVLEEEMDGGMMRRRIKDDDIDDNKWLEGAVATFLVTW